MIVNQNSFSYFGTEREALETETYHDRKGLIRFGSSFCRQDKTPLSKVDVTGEFSNDIAEKNAKTSAFEEKKKAKQKAEKSAGTNDVPMFDHFQRETPVRPVGIGSGKTAMSRRTKTKIRQKIMAWGKTVRNPSGGYRLAFVTLQLVGDQRDADGQLLTGNAEKTKQFNQMLNVFFTYCRKYVRLKDYLYVLEIQLKKTGRLHAHILVDMPYAPFVRLNHEWCKIQRDFGIKRDDGTEIVAGKAGVNPFQHDKIFNINTLPGYITKYVTKNESEIDGTKWNCSNSISRLFTGVRFWDSNTASVLLNHVRHSYDVKLTDGNILHIHLLSQYTEFQAKAFRLNDYVIAGTFDREAYIKSLQAV